MGPVPVAIGGYASHASSGRNKEQGGATMVASGGAGRDGALSGEAYGPPHPAPPGARRARSGALCAVLRGLTAQ